MHLGQSLASPRNGKGEAPQVAFRIAVAQLSAMAIDHEQRRADIASITIDLIAQEGLEAASIRRIAAEAGSSTSAITSYFADKQELLVWAFQTLSEEGERRFQEALANDANDVIGALLTMVPWCAVNVRRWKAYLAFWDQAARDPELAALLTQSTAAGLEYLQQLLRSHGAGGTVVESAGRLLNAVIQGLALQMLVDRQNWSEEKARTVLQEAFDFAILMANH